MFGFCMGVYVYGFICGGGFGSGYVLCIPMKSASMIVLFLGSYAVVLSTKSAEISYPMVCGVATDCE